jgi:sugar O-acyltransferase (sialic acid O-acetyltransferase NeuD family)
MSAQAKAILVYGSLEFGQVVKDLAQQCGYEFRGYIDDFNKGGEIAGGWEEAVRSHPPSSCVIAIAVGYKHLRERRALSRRAQECGYTTPALIHPRAYVRDPAAVAAGAFVMAGAVVDVGARVGEFTVIWPGAMINHHSNVGGNTFISPNATVCGHVTLGEDCFVGAGATIVDHQSVPAGSFIKAGSVYAHGE